MWEVLVIILGGIIIRTKIYQINLDRDKGNNAFRSLEDLNRLTGQAAIDASLYNVSFRCFVSYALKALRRKGFSFLTLHSGNIGIGKISQSRGLVPTHQIILFGWVIRNP